MPAHTGVQHGGGGPEVFPLILLCALLCARRGAGTPCCPASSWAGCTCCSSGSPREPGAGTGPRKLPTPAQVRSAKAFDPRPYSCWQSELAMWDSSTLGLPRPTGGSAGARGGAAGMLSGVGSGRGGTAGYASASRGRGGAGRSSPAVIGSAAVSPPGWCFPSAGSALRRGRGCSAGSAHAAAPRAAPAARQLPPPSLAGEFIYLFICSFPSPTPPLRILPLSIFWPLPRLTHPAPSPRAASAGAQRGAMPAGPPPLLLRGAFVLLLLVLLLLSLGAPARAAVYTNQFLVELHSGDQAEAERVAADHGFGGVRKVRAALSLWEAGMEPGCVLQPHGFGSPLPAAAAQQSPGRAFGSDWEARSFPHAG